MPRTIEEQKQWEKQAYGLTWDELVDRCEHVYWNDYFDVLNFSMSIQSDVQWMIDNDEDKEEIKRALNVSKKCISLAKEMIRKDPIGGSELRKLGY